MKPVPSSSPKPAFLVSGTGYPTGYTTRILPWGRVSDAAKWDAARHIMCWLCQSAEGSYNRPETWLGVAQRRNIHCRQYTDKSEGRGAFFAPSRAAPEHVGGIIYINLAYDECEQVRGWVHELAHCILYFWQVGTLESGADALQYDGETDETHHEIACMVEQLMFD